MPWRPPQRSQTTCKPPRGVDAQHRHPQPQSTCHCQLTLRRSVGVRGQSHTCVSRRRTGSDDSHHQPATFRRHRPPRPTRLRLVESRYLCRRRAARRAAVAPSSGRLWAGTAVTVLTSRPVRAMGRALHSPGLDEAPPWLRGRCSLCCSTPADKGGRCRPDGIEHQVQKLYSRRLSHWIPIAACRGKLCQH